MTVSSTNPASAASSGATSARRLPQASSSAPHALLAAFLIALILPLEFSVGGLALNPTRILLLIAIPVLVANFCRGLYGKFILTDLFFLCHIVWMAVTLAVNNPESVVSQVGSVGLEFVGGYLIGRACIRSAEDFILLIKWLVGMVLFMMPFALVETQTGVPILLEAIRKLPGISTHSNVHHEPRMGLLRAQVLINHPIHFGMFCSTAFSLVLIGLQDRISKSQRYLLTFLIGATTFMSLSSGAFLALVFQLILILWAWTLAAVPRRWLILFLITAFFYVVIDILSNRTPVEVALSYLTFSPHTAYWRTIIFEWGMKNVWDNPIFGIGLNDWERPYYMYSGSMDNYWLVNAVRHGIPGFVFVAAGYVYMLIRVGQRDFSGDQRLENFRLAWIITMVSLAFTLSTVHIWQAIYSFVFFLLGSGGWMISAEANAQDAKPEETNDRPVPRYSRFPKKFAKADLRR